MSRCRFCGVQGLFDVNIYVAIGYFILFIMQNFDDKRSLLSAGKRVFIIFETFIPQHTTVKQKDDGAT